MSEHTCAACRSSRVEPGVLASAAIWLDAQSTLSKAFSGAAQVKVLACLDCGHLVFRAEPEELQKLIAG